MVSDRKYQDYFLAYKSTLNIKRVEGYIEMELPYSHRIVPKAHPFLEQIV